MGDGKRKRRRCVLALGSLLASALTRPALADPPPGKVLRIGLLYGIRSKFDPSGNAVDRALLKGLRERGYEIGRNFVLEFRSGAGELGRVPAIARELVELKPDMLIALGMAQTLAAHDATNTIPIITLGAEDPVASGLARSLARPGGNLTGMAVNSADLAAKRVQLLSEAVPKLAKVAVLWNANIKSMEISFQNIDTAAPQLGVRIQSIRVTGSADLDRAFTALEQGQPDGLVVLFGPMRGDDLPRIVEFVARRRLPAMFELGRGVQGGGLMEFGADIAEAAGRIGAYVDKIANRVSPSDLPIEEPTKFEFVVNRKAAKEIGLDLRPGLLVRATKIVE